MFKILRSVLLIQALLLITIASTAQQRAIVRGKVTSAFEPQGVIGVTVAELDANNRLVSGTVTNLDGNYLLEVRNIENRLQFTSIGYLDQIVEIQGRTTINVVMNEAVTELAGAEIVAHRRTQTGSLNVPDRNLAIPIAKISADVFEGVHASSIDEALQGRLAGVDITANTGDPGAGMNIRIRGVNTLTGDASPLIVVDNIPYEINVSSDFNFATANEEGYSQMLNIPVDDIAEIAVLKDAAATAMWGTRAANGVLLITTRRGSRSTKPLINYTFRGTYTFDPPTIPLLNGNQYNTLIQEAWFNSYGTPLPFETYREFLQIPDDPYFYHNYGQNTNWLKAVSQNGFIQNHDFSISGGGNRAVYRFSVNYQGQEGTTIGTGLDRLSTRLNLDYTISDRLRLRADFAYNHADTRGNYRDNTFRDGRELRSVAYRKMPNMSIYEYDAFGNLTGNFFSPEFNAQGTAPNTYNPVAMGNDGFTRTINDRITNRLSLYYEILEGLRYTMDLSFDVNTNKVRRFLPQTATGRTWTDSWVNRAFDKDDDSYTIYTNNQLYFNRMFNAIHDFTASVNFQTNERIGSLYELETANSASSLLQDPSLDNKYREAGLGFNSGPWRGRDVGATATVHYVLLDRYIASGSIRYEGNSKFDEKNRFGMFPGVSAAWRISGEPFMEDFTSLNDLRLRFSYGENGRVPRREGMFFNNYGTFAWSYLGYNAVYPINMQLENLKWESFNSTNYGVSIEMFNGRLMVDADYYLNTTKDMLVYDTPIPSTTGFSRINVMNLGTLDNIGYDLSVRTVPIRQSDLRVTFDFNIARNYNILREVADNYPLERSLTLYNGQYRHIVQVDNPIGSFYGYRYKGVYTEPDQLIARDAAGNQILDPNGNPVYMVFDYRNVRYPFQLGDAMYEDINHDGNIDAQDVVYIGDANPDFYGGFGSLIDYKNFSFNYYFYFRVGNDIINKTKMDGENMYYFDNQLASTLRRWRAPGDETDIPRAMMGQGYNWLGSDRFVEDGSFLRLKYITLTYRVPNSFSQRFGMQNMRLSATMNNLLTFTRYTGQDPEININQRYGDIFTVGEDHSRTPVAKQFTFNLSVTF
ncbi:SusC/RagA family TonB-linked outer membrane protein [Alkalitalea saponilacus]|uniref:TonB-linked outer membrane protein, SusC/RagA family n=1 Tax=Alkalitalea saponilacus TaxID=889453 RepID=A0A1T5EUV3_9BACT|nr:SusC/RagA family TonB-linked outer membrane protein [Alkalitalea saponilacus]SKB87628.1 TonB-linked outer membrane protein, SusC/RagA family [Alkalitalea saponilacus]